jgi:phosphotransferase system enzyme I (PtsI)
VNDPAREIQRLDLAFGQTRLQLQQLQTRMNGSTCSDVAGIFQAQMALLEDADFLEQIRAAIRTRAVNTEYLIATEIRKLESFFQEGKDEVLRSRFLDIQDVYHRLLRNLLGIEHVRTNPFRKLTSPVVLVADRMLPSDVGLLDLNKVLGMVIEEGSRVSHVSIIARSLGIPAITEATHATRLVRSGDIVLLNADEGLALVHPDDADVSAYQRRRRKQRPAGAGHRARAVPASPCQTSDGLRVGIEANVGSVAEARLAVAAGAEGIGLLRSEFFYLSSPRMPTAEEETAFYRKVLRAMRKRPTTIRLLDLGADKTLPYLQIAREDNPQLGMRGTRLLLDSPELMLRHITSILRVGDAGPIRLLIPFVATLADLERVLEAIDAVCRQEQVPREQFQVGIMVEIPSVAMDVGPFLPRVDFLSIGTNDLVQYVFAANREDRRLESYRIPHHPIVLRLIHAVTTAARKQNKPVSVCGEMASDPVLAPVLVGLGVNALSMQASAIRAVHAGIGRHSRATLERIASQALQAGSADQVLAACEPLR